MALRQKKRAIRVLVDGQPPQKALVITSKAGPGLSRRLSALIPRLVAVCLRLFGVGLAGVGATHFVAPQAWEPLSKVAFPQDTRRWTYQNGLTELLLGLSLTSPRTRILGGIGGLAYLAFLGSRVAGNIRR